MEIVEQIMNYINSNKLEEALELILENDNILSCEPKFQSLKAILCIKSGEYNTAINFLLTVISKCPEDVDAYYNIAYAYECMGIYSDAAIYYGMAEKYTCDEELKNELHIIYANNSILNNIKNTVLESKKKTFIMLSSCPWGDMLQRMHHIARSLVKLGQKVHYVCPLIDANINQENISIEKMIKYSCDNSKIIDGVQIYNTIRASHNNKVISNNYTALVQVILNDAQQQGDTIIVPYMPYQVGVIKSLKGNFKVIYECVDDHTDFKYAFWGNKKDTVWEQELMDISDAITTTATSLYLQRVAIEERENVYLSRNAVNEGDFLIGDEEIPDDLKNIPEPRIVYTGAVYGRYDEELFYEVVESNPDKSFVIIGPVQEGMMKRKYNNLYLLGPKKHSELKNYLKYMQIGIVPYIDDADIDIACDSIKQYEYIAAGLPVITTFMPESAMNKIYTYLANEKENFNIAIEECLSIKVDNNKVNDFLIKNSWNERANLLCNIANGIIDKEHKKNEIKNIGEKLFDICEKYDYPTFEALKAVYLNLENSWEFEKYAKQAYIKGGNSYIEKQYLSALLKNNNITAFIDVVQNSSNINEEIKAELIYVQKLNNEKLLKVILYLCVEDIRTTIILVEKLNDYNFKVLYKLYIEYVLGGEKIKSNELQSIKSKAKYAPLFKFLKEKKLEAKTTRVNINTNNDPFISIIVPTRNSADVLRYSLMTCIEQNYDNYEIIVSDNSSPGNDETKELVNELNCKKIKYFRTPKEYEMKENYEFAYNQSKGEYILLIGSDDGLLLHCLEVLSGVIKQLNWPKTITWDPVAYGWPNVAISSIRNGLFTPYPTQKNNIQCTYYDESMLKAVLNFRKRYSILPMFYYNSIIKRDMAEEAKKAAGKIFYGAPDVSTGILFAYLQKKYIHINMPMTIGGSSHKSAGLSDITDINHSEYDKIKHDLEQVKKYNNITSKCEFFYTPNFATEETAVLRSFIIAKSLYLKDNKNFNVDMNKYYEICSKYLFDDIDLEKKKEYLYHSIKEYGDDEIKKWYEKNYVNNKDFNGYINNSQQPLIPSYRPNGGLVIDCSKFNVCDVFSAANLYKNIVGY